MNTPQIKYHRNLELDRLRAFALLMTIFIHYSRVFFPWNIHQDYQSGGTLLNLLQNSWMGVDLFFVISGFIISTMIVSHIDYYARDVFQLANFVKNFFIKRFFRIYPLAITFFVFTLLCSIVFNKTGSFSTPENTIEAGISMFTYTFNYYFGSGKYHGFTLSPYWSLSVEEQFYLIFPFFLIFVKSHKSRIFLLVLMLLVLTFIIRPLSEDNIFYTQNRCDGLIYGCLLYYICNLDAFKSLFKEKIKTKFSSILIIAIFVFILGTITSIGFPNKVVIPIGCFISTLLVGIASIEINMISFGKIFNAILDYLGSRSYSLYITHFPMFTLTQEIFYRLSLLYHWKIDETFFMPYTIVAISLTICISELSYRFVEKPWIIRGKNYLLNKTENTHEKRNISSFVAN